MGFLVMVGMSTAMAEASSGVMSDTLKQRINGQTVRGRPTFHLSVNLNDQCSHEERYDFFSSAISVFMIFL